MDSRTLGLIVGAVLLTTVVLYIYDRRSKQQAVDVFDAAKLGIGAAAIAGGVSYAVGGEAVVDALQTVASSLPEQEMFIGKADF